MEQVGYRIAEFSDKEIGQIYSEGISRIDLKENEYLVVKDSSGEIIDKFKFQNGELCP